MKEDGILKDIGQAIGEAEYLDDPRWRLLASGLLDEKQQQKFRHELTNRPDGPSCEQLETAWNAFSPLPENSKQKLAGLFISSKQQSLISRFFAWMIFPPRRVFVTATAVLGALSLVLVFAWPQTVPELPVYRLEFEGGDIQTRSLPVSAEVRLARLSQDSLLHFTLRPQTDIKQDGNIRLIVFLAQEREVIRVKLPVFFHHGGTITVEGRVGELLHAQPGRYRLVLVVGSGAISKPKTTDIEHMTRDGKLGSWQVFVKAIELVDD